MASPAELRRQIRDLISTLEPEVAEAFMESIREIRSSIVLTEVVAALKAGNIGAAIVALHIDEAAFAPLAEAVTAAYNRAGGLTMQLLPAFKDRQGHRVVVRWDVRNPRAEDEIRQFSSTLLTYVTEETKEVARQTIVRGYEKGQGPQQIAVDLAGRVNRITGQREGGVIGLSQPQLATVENLRTRLLGGDPAELRAIIGIDAEGKPVKDGGMKLRNKTYDRAIKKAIATGKPLNAEAVDEMVKGYVSKAIKHRGDMIARTETGEAVMKARQESTRQAAEKAGYSDTAISKKWKHSHKLHRREDHFTMNNKTVIGLDTPFVFPGGVRMRFPMDRSLGATGKDIIGCACDYEINFDFSQGLT